MPKSDDYVTATRYDPNTGEILGQRIGFYRDVLSEPYSFVLGEGDSKTQYIDTTKSPPVIRARPAMAIRQSKTTIIADGVDSMTLSGLPVPCDVTIGNSAYHVEDGELEWGTLMPRVYEIRVNAFPYLEWSTEVTAIASTA
jgi:hypothetical protein